MEITHQLGALVITLLWIYVMFILADFPSIGIYLIMLKSVAKVLINFLALFSFIIIAFSLGFHLLVPEPGHENPLLSLLTTLGRYQRFHNIFVLFNFNTCELFMVHYYSNDVW